MSSKNINTIIAMIILAGVILLIVGLSYDIPSRKISFYTIEEYVGGDAYNAMIEASLLGGEISAAETCKAIYTVGGIITISIGFLTGTLKAIMNKKEEA